MDLSSLVTASRQLTAHIPRPDLPTINLGLDQIEQQSRRLVQAQPTAPDPAKASYLLAQAQIDSSALGAQIANLNTQSTFAPLQPIHDTDIAGFLRHAHEQSLIASIEEGRRETEAEFYRVLDERVRRDWENRKKRIFEELGVKTESIAPSNSADLSGIANVFSKTRMAASRSGKGLGLSTATTPQTREAVPMDSKKMAYDVAITRLNSARLAQTSFPLILQLKSIAMEGPPGSSVVNKQFAEMLEILLGITSEQPQLAYSHAQAHLLNNSNVLERSFARAYLGDQNSNAAQELREKIIAGSRMALETQYWQHLDNVVQSKPVDAALGGDPGLANRVRAFLSVKFYKNGRWEERLELIASKPLWAQMFYLIRTGNIREALEVATASERQLNDHEPHFVTALRAWVESPDRRLPRHSKERLFTSFNSRIAFGPNVDPFKQALFKILGRIEPHKKTVPLVTVTTEDWIWFQLAMADEQEGSGLRELGESLEGFGEKHFSGAAPDTGSPSSSTMLSRSALGPSSAMSSAARKLSWARLLLTCGLFEKSVAALYEHPELQTEAMHLAIVLVYYGLLRVPSRDEMTDVDVLISSPHHPVSLNFALLINRYIRSFQKSDPQKALQYCYCVALGCDLVTSGFSDYQRTVSNDQLELSRELVRRVIISCEGDGQWAALVGGLRDDGTRYSGAIEHFLPLLRLASVSEYNDVILKIAAEMCETSRKHIDAIKLYSLAGARETVMACLARALGELLSEPGGGGAEGKLLEQQAESVLRSYDARGERTRDSQDVIKLIRIRNAMEKYAQNDLDGALESIEAADLIPLDSDIHATTRKMDEFKSMDPSVTRNLGEILVLTMNVLIGLHARIKNSKFNDPDRQSHLNRIRKKATALMTFAGMQKYSLSSDVFAKLTQLEVRLAY